MANIFPMFVCSVSTCMTISQWACAHLMWHVRAHLSLKILSCQPHNSHIFSFLCAWNVNKYVSRWKREREGEMCRALWRCSHTEFKNMNKNKGVESCLCLFLMLKAQFACCKRLINSKQYLIDNQWYLHTLLSHSRNLIDMILNDSFEYSSYQTHNLKHCFVR